MKKTIFTKQASSKGQIILEYILLLLALVSIMHLGFNFFKENKTFEEFRDAPNNLMSNMIETGSWKTNINEAREEHSNLPRRHYSAEIPGE